MTTDLSPSGIQRLLEICEAATEGPWRAPGRKNGVVTSDECQICKCGDFLDPELVPYNADRWNADRDLIVAARTALPDALRRIAALEVASADLPAEPSRSMIIAALEASLKFRDERGLDDVQPDSPGDIPSEMVRVVWRAMRAKLIEEAADLRKARAVLSGGNGE